MIGLYPIVDSSDWIAKLLPLGIKTIQLRIKTFCPQLASEIQKSIALAKQYQATLYINDYWDLAIKYGASGVHLGQEDLNHAPITRIVENGLKLGISTHSEAEIERAQRFSPSYLAFGPIYPTTSKLMSCAAQGLAKLRYWVDRLDYPVVAIGGIQPPNFQAVLETGAQGIAVISAITDAVSPVEVVQLYTTLKNRYSRDLAVPSLRGCASSRGNPNDGGS